MNTLRRYEILVPLLFNDGTPVPETVLRRLLPNCAPNSVPLRGKPRSCAEFGNRQARFIKTI